MPIDVEDDQSAGGPAMIRSERVKLEIIEVTRRLLAWAPYTEVGVRMVAREAGVSPALVMKYFGSKERLVASAIDFTDAFDRLLDGPARDLGCSMLAQLARIPEAPIGTDPLGALLFIAGSRGLPLHLRGALLEQFVDRLASRLQGDDRERRAELIAAIVLGTSLMRRTVQAPHLRAMDADVLSATVGPVVQRYIDGTVESPNEEVSTESVAGS